MSEYKVLGKVGEGSFSEVLKCQDRETGAVYAAKRLKKVKESITDALKTPEVVAMRKLKPHPNILQLIESHFDPFPGKVTLIFELMEMSMYDMLKNRKSCTTAALLSSRGDERQQKIQSTPQRKTVNVILLINFMGIRLCLPEIRVKNYLYQLMKGVDHLHRHGLFHRDIKPENILIKNEIVKLADLGSVRGIYGKPPFTEYISTRWYRSPECLLTTGYYGPKMDVWATGCVFFELLTLKPLFPGSNEMDQINKIHAILGTPSARLVMKFRRHKSRNCECYFPTKAGSGICSLLPNISENGRDILKHMLIYDPEMRPNTRRLLEHRYFNDLREDDLAPRRRSYSVAPGPTSKEIHNPALLSYIATEKRKKSKRTSTNKTNEAPKLPRVVVSSPNHRPAQTIIHSGRQMPANPQLSNLRPQKAETMLCVQEKRWAAPLSKKSSQQMLPRRVRGQVTIPNDGRIHLPPIEVKQTQKTTNLVQSTSIRRGASTIPSLPSIQTNVEKITTSASFLSLPPLVKKTEPLLHRIFPPSGSTNKLPFSNSSLNGLRHIHEKRRLTTIEEHPTSSPPNKNQRQS